MRDMGRMHLKMEINDTTRSSYCQRVPLCQRNALAPLSVWQELQAMFRIMLRSVAFQRNATEEDKR